MNLPAIELFSQKTLIRILHLLLLLLQLFTIKILQPENPFPKKKNN